MPLGKPKAPKAPKKPKAPKAPKAPKEKKPKKPKPAKPPKAKKVKKGKNAPEELEGQEGLEEGQEPKKKKPLILLLIPPVVIAAAAAIIFLVVLPRMKGETDADPEPSATLEPQAPELPTAIPIGEDVSIVGMALEADESGAQAVKAKTVTYTYNNLNDAGKAAQTYAGQLAGESPAFSVVDEEFVRQKGEVDYTAAEGMVLLARNAPAAEKPAASAAPESEPPDPAQGEAFQQPGAGSALQGLLTAFPKPEPEPEPEEEPVSYVHTVRITWSPGVCVVTADEEEGKVTSPQSSGVPGGQSLGIRGAVKRLQEMAPAKLGLEGESMDEYELIPMDATEMVNGTACINVYIYNSDDYQFAGSYLLSIDGLHLYRFDPTSRETVELKDYP